MTLYFLSFRDIASSSVGVTSGEFYALPDVGPTTQWPTERLAGANWVPWADVANLLRHKRVCFVVHGFNVNVDHGVKGGGPAAQEYETFGSLGLTIANADLVIPVLWPGDGLLGWSWFTAYGHSKATGGKFAELMASSAFTADQVSFVSHSLGARVVLETVAQAVAQKVRPMFDTAILTAPAVDDNALDDPEYVAATAALRRIVVLSSMKDLVLQLAFTVGSAVEKALWADYHGDTRALGRYGPAFKAGSKAPGKTEWYEVQPGIGQDHGDYFPAGWNPGSAWSPKQTDVGRFCHEAFDALGYTMSQSNWGFDHTDRFRPGWVKRFR